MLVTISKYPKGASLEASAYFKESIKKKCPRHAKIPIRESHNHCVFEGLVQTIGTKKDVTKIFSIQGIKTFYKKPLKIFQKKASDCST